MIGLKAKSRAAPGSSGEATPKAVSRHPAVGDLAGAVAMPIAPETVNARRISTAPTKTSTRLIARYTSLPLRASEPSEVSPPQNVNGPNRYSQNG